MDAIGAAGECIEAYGQAVWSCPANAGDKPWGRKPEVTVAKSWFTGEITE
jgi:hypothetical protein